MSIEYELEELSKNWERGSWYYPNYTEKNPDKETKAYWWEENFGEIHFENNSQKAIWMMLQGQLSDGYWENANVDWEFWRKLKPIVDNTLGWRCNNDYIPFGEWPVCVYGVLDCLKDEYKGVAKHYSELKNYDDDAFYHDLDMVKESMGKSLRKIGYLE